METETSIRFLFGNCDTPTGSGLSSWMSYNLHLTLSNPKDPGEANWNSQMMRIAVVGTSCSGKTTLASRIAHALKIPHVELDSLHWGPDWQPRPAEDFRQDVEAAAIGESWVIDGNYRSVRDILWPRATHLIWLNYPFAIVFWRALARTLKRIVTQEMLSSGNRETMRMAIFEKDSILLWVIRTHRRRAREYREITEGGCYPHMQIIELRRPSQAEETISKISDQCSQSSIHLVAAGKECENGLAVGVLQQ